MFIKLLTTVLAVHLAGAQYGPIKRPAQKHTTTPFPVAEPDYSPEVNSVEENSGVLPGSYTRPQTPAGAVSAPDNPWLSGVIGKNPVSYGGSRAPAPAYPAPAPAYQPAPAPAPAYQPAPTVACNAPGHVCAPRQQCQGGVTSSPGTGSSQCDANSEVCCRHQQPQPAYQPPPQPAYRPQPQPQPAYRPPAPAPAPAYQPQPAYQQPAYQAQPQPQPQNRPYQPAAPIGGSIYDSQPPPSRPRPVPQYNNNYVTEAPIQRYTGPLNTTPHPGCAAALKCVEEVYCTWDGVMSDAPQYLTREQTENKVPLSDCQNIETGIIGKCCRDPNYKDPWPAGMMMNSGPFDDGQYHPGVQFSGAPAPAPVQQPAYTANQPAYAPQQPQYTPNAPSYAPQQPQYTPQQPQPQYTPQQPQPQYTPQQQQQPLPSFNARPSGTERASCGPSATCTPHNLCPGERHSQPGKACRVPNDDSTGVCCAKLQFPQQANNQQYRPPSNKPSTNPYFAPKPAPPPAAQPQPNPYNAPRPAPPAQPQPNPYNAPKPAPQAQPQPNPYNAPKPAPQAQPQPNPYNAPRPAPQPQPQPNPYNAPRPAPAPQQQPNPYSAPKQAPQPNPYNAPKPQPEVIDRNDYPTATTPKPEKTNEIVPEIAEPLAQQTPPPPFIRTTPQPKTTHLPQPQTTPQPQPEPGKECGVRREVPRPNGPNGPETGFGEFPWHAQILTAQDSKPACSGAILAENIIVTAAHCVNSLTAQSILVKAGDWKLATENPSEEPKPVQIRNVAAIAVHPLFDANTLANDMAVIVLQDPLQFDQHVDKLCLGKDAAPGQPPSGKNCVITGWGKDATKGNTPGSTLHSIPVNFMPNQQCQDAFKSTFLGKYFKLHDSFTCALPTSPTHDLCQVDAGSPIACQKPDGKYELSGIYSWDTGCHKNKNSPVAMSKPDEEFIKSVMEKPIDEIKKETEAEKQRQSALGQSAEEAQASKPGFSQGYGK